MRTILKIIVGVGLSCALIVASVFISNQSTSKFASDMAWTLHSAAVRDSVEELTTLFESAQNNMRGFHMSEQDYYLKLHADARDQLFAKLNFLKELTKDNEIQKASLEKLSLLLEEKAVTWKKSLETRQKGGWEAIRKQILLPDSKNQNELLLSTLGTIKNEEDRLFTERVHAAEIQAQNTKVVVAAGGLLACLLILIASFVVYNDHRKRELAEAQIDRFFNLSLDLLCVSGMDGYFKRLSPSYSEVLGYPLEELYSRMIVDFIHPDDIARTNAEIASQMDGNKVLSFENRFRCADGTYRSFSWKSVPAGQFMYAVARDVTNQKEFENDLVEARETALKADLAKTSFLANMSHEIRTPLNGVVGMSDLLSRTNLDPEQYSFVTGIRDSAKNLLRIVNEILDFSKIETGNMRLERSHFDLAQMIEGQISLLGVSAHSKGLKLELSLDPKLPRDLYGDSGKLSQVILNLVTNAIKFTERGRIVVDASVSDLTKTSAKIKIRVFDSGIGMNEDQMKKLFEPFSQADDSTARKYGGTGLGLSICKKMIELMGGEIGVESKPGRGSAFWFRVNLDIVNSAQMETSNNRTSQLSIGSSIQASSPKSLRVLIAEDNHINQEIVMKMMAVLGYSPTLVENGAEAVKQFSTGAFDLILMDQHMPVMDGVQASKEIRNAEKGSGRRIPIIAFTATVIQEEEKEYYRTLMDDFLLKPVTLESLQSMLHSWDAEVSKQSKNS